MLPHARAFRDAPGGAQLGLMALAVAKRQSLHVETIALCDGKGRGGVESAA
jgi:hypothetical protein